MEWEILSKELMQRPKTQGRRLAATRLLNIDTVACLQYTQSMFERYGRLM